MKKILDVKISDLSFDETVNTINDWIVQNFKKKYICICNTHSLVESKKNYMHKKALLEASICTPDGMPLVWEINKSKKSKNQDRVDGPSLMEKLCESKTNKIFLLGSTDENLSVLETKLRNLNPEIKLVGSYSPPFKTLDSEDDKRIVNIVNDSNADIVFVSLGCPKQEIWMNKNYESMNSILIGVGAAFDFHTGKIKRAPSIIQKVGMEWMYRLLQDPKRLWKRYLINNSLYILFIVLSRLRKKE
ncbi:WecB/TagA/CpsF family glycosyltransferase [Exiguobacterium sp. s102]|uniref:WecB/TagA/CpsF family glycosyltransferase n=1 Tax=Exiguobacterium sp. s102 TaxID=2751212 RepID=UPI001BEBF598|nr:WecB/TagA/CpsF family glycosyltransferase [Exiguobacterium sp. s102]